MPDPLYHTQIEPTAVPSPCFVVHLGAIRQNLAVLDRVQREAGCTILLALKGFAMWGIFPLLREVLGGTCASSIDEARLGCEEFGPHVHSYAPAYKEAELAEYLQYSSHLSFNSVEMWLRHREAIATYNRESNSPVSCGFRVNPEHREVDVAIYDPCGPRSRLGLRLESLEQALSDGLDLTGIEGLHFHNLCQKNSDSLIRTLKVVEEKFGRFFSQLKWINMGGGHHISRPDYDVQGLIELISDFRQRTGLEVVLEPGEAIGLNAGVLVAEVQDVIENAGAIAILDTSASDHMPDVLEMPYRPEIIGAGLPEEKAHTYRLGGLTCLAGDVIGDYSFDEPLTIGRRLIFTDMAHYSMVKTTTFNGLRLPSIATYEPETGETKILRTFAYEDYKDRLS